MDERQAPTQMKLFVWTGFCPDYSGGLAFAIAADVGSAQQQIIESIGYNPSNWGVLHELPVDSPVAFSVSGGS